ncbi:non-ribosomal peptide synthetase [Streptomyces longispororuber]|uniref:non-ribosomal peptide synthetase n=1 Tax=Streptomyces longispororuber TaxID=68230 RepID=UPI00167D72AC|nr:non-ribosomal peptide synthetase [Streptomyces longispororuber]
MTTSPDAVAVEDGAVSLTYRELDERAEQVARGLLAAGVRAESVVAVALRRSVEWVTVLLGVVRAGAAYLPLDTAHPAERLAYMVDTSGCALVVADASATTELPGVTVPVLRPEELGGNAPAPAFPRPAQSAYVIYTSGSTGRPKGVVVTHGGLADLAATHATGLGVTRGSRVLQFASPGFDASVWELCMALLCGATLVLADDADLAPGRPLAETLTSRRVTHVTLPPPVLATLPTDAMPAVECLVVAGDVTTPNLVEAWAGERKMINAYGPTETTVCATMSAPLAADGRAPTIGHAVEGARVQVLDATLRPVPPDTVGELYVSGPLLARGYLGNPGETAARFVPDVSGPPGARMYRTGDLAARSADGTLAFHGRADTQVKIHGVRIETHEVAAVLTAHPGVADAVVVARETRSSKQLVAYVVPKERGERESGVSSDSYGSLALEPSFSVGDLRAFAARLLPAPMVPAAFVPLERIPLTPNGKPDLAELPAPRLRQRAYQAPRDETETALARQFAEVLGIDEVGVDDDFFVIGGDSIQSIQVVSRLRERGIHLSAQDVFERRTVAALAELAATRSAASVEVLAELDGGGVGSMPMLPVARWIRDWGPGFDRFAQAMVVSLPDGIDEAGLEQTLLAVLDRHDMLRARLVGDEVVVSAPGTVVPAVDRVEGVDQAGPEWQEAVARHLDRAAAGLDPSAGALARFVWFDGRPGALLVVLHHLVVDGVSWRILQSDLADAWAAVRGGRKPRLPEVRTSMRTWAHALAEEARSPRRLAELPLWRSILAGPDPLVGGRRLDPSVDVVGTVAEVPVTVPVPVTEALLTTVPSVFRGEVLDGLLAALALALTARRRAKGDAESSVLIRMEGHGREESAAPGADLSRTVGWFTTVYPVRLDLDGVDVTDALAGGPAAGRAVMLAKQRLRAVPDRGIGYGLLRHLNDDTAAVLDAYPMAQVGFNYLGRFAPAGTGSWSRVEVPQLAHLDSGQDPRMPAPAELDINASLVDTDQGPQLRAVFAAPSGVLARHEVEELAGLWCTALAGLARRAAVPGVHGLTPSDVPLASVTQADLDVWAERHPDLEDVWPLTPLQSGLLFHSMTVDSGFDAYQVQYVLRLLGPLDAERMRAAGQRLLSRHAGLRSVFAPDERGETAQLVLADAELPWRVVDLGDLDEAARTTAFERLLADDLREHFDPVVPPMLRMTLVRSAPDVADLVLTAHHAVVDGWSIPLIVRELLLHYGSRSAELPRVRSQRDFLQWRAEQNPAESAAVWARELDGVDGPTLVAGGRRTDDDGAGIGQVDAALSAAESEAVAACAARLGVTVNTLVQTAWAVLLSRLTGRRDVLFGAVVSGRPPAVPGVDAIVGMLLNTVPVRLDCAPFRALGDLVVDLQRRQAALLDHHHHGLSELHQASGVTALFDTVVGFQSFPLDRTGIAGAGHGAGLQVVGIRSFTVSHYPLALMVFAEPDSPLRPCVQYRRDVFGRAEATAVAARFARILRQLANDPDLRVGAVDALLAAERTAPAAEGAAPAGRTVPALLAARARRTPDAVAVRCDGDALTYQDLDRRATEVARAWAERGVAPGTTVAVRLPSPPDAVVALVAAQRAGCCPVAPDDDADLVVTGLPAPGTGTDRAPVRPADIAALLPSWGHADGRRTVAVSHEALAARVAHAATEAALLVDRTADGTGDFGSWLVDVLGAVCAGGGVEFAAADGHATADGHAAADERAAAGVPGDPAKGTTACAAPEWGRASASPSRSGEQEPVGPPSPGTRFHVLDNTLQPAPPGAVGELYVAGPALGLGYHGRPGTTAAWFVPDPFGPGASRMVRTGDLVRLGHDGGLEFVGRADGQVTVRGVRISPPAVEAVLAEHPEVADVAVVAGAEDGGPHLSAYVVGADLDTGDLAAFAAARLPRCMVPDAVVPLTYLPRLPNGRVDVSGLASAERAERVHREPRDRQEEVLCALFAEVLEVDDIGIDDGFFALGGTSLMATRLSSRIRKELGVTVAIRSIFESATIVDLAHVVKKSAKSTKPALRRMDRGDRS